MRATRLALLGLALALLAFGLPGSEDTPAPQPAKAKPARTITPVARKTISPTTPVHACAERPAKVDRQPSQRPSPNVEQPRNVILTSAAEARPVHPRPRPKDLGDAKLQLVQLLSSDDKPRGVVKTADLEQLLPGRPTSEPLVELEGKSRRSSSSSPMTGESLVRPADVKGGASSGATGSKTPYDYTETSSSDPTEGWTLPQPGFLARRRIRLGGWLDQGVSVVANQPADGYNGVVTFNDRDGEYQMNQLYFFLERETATDCGGWDLGGRVDFLYGTDSRFTQAADGLEEDWGQTARFYQAALPQFYFDVAYNDWILRLGHFYTILGYEVVPAPGNFFYSHSYTMQYGEPFTHTGFLLMRQFGERLRLSAGLHRGNDQFDDTDGRNGINFLGGLTWTSEGGNFSVAFGITAGEQGLGVDQSIYSLVATWKATERLRYVIQHDYGWTDVDRLSPLEGEWYGINQYFLWDLNERWAAGLRVEWFRDDDGTRVRGLGQGNLNQGPFAGNFYEITAGLNWHPNANLTFRPEVRWDWYDSNVVGGSLPYDAGQKDDQFLFGCDLIFTY